jgi:hypothetical protein
MQGIVHIIFDDPERDTRVVAYADRYAADRHGELFFLSIGGESMAVRAVLAALASRKSVTVEGSTQHSWLMFPWNSKVKFRTARLSSGLAHGVVWNEDSSNGLFVQDVTPESVYRAVYEAFPVTLLPEWAGWLTKRLRQQSWLVDLDGVGMKAGLIRATTGGLDRLVSDGVKAGELNIAAGRHAA